jgi:hypothetical protein
MACAVDNVAIIKRRRLVFDQRRCIYNAVAITVFAVAFF